MNKLLRCSAAILVFFLLVPFLFSCKEDEGEIVFAYGEVQIPERLYIYELSVYKSEILSNYGSTGVDSPSLWTSDMGNGTTFEDHAYAQFQLNISQKLFFADYALKHGGDITEEQNKAIDAQIDSVIQQIGSKNKVNEYLADYSIDLDLYRRWLEIEQLYVNGCTLAYGEGGEREIGYQEAYDYYENNYVTVKHIATGTNIAGKTQSGEVVYYTDEEKEAKRQRIEELRERIDAGEDFDVLYLESEDKQSETYPDGYTIGADTLSDEMQAYEDMALSLEIGEVGEIEIENYGHYFIKRVEILESDFYNCYTHFYSTLVELDTGAAILENYDNFTMNQEIIDSYSMATAPVMK